MRTLLLGLRAGARRAPTCRASSIRVFARLASQSGRQLKPARPPAGYQAPKDLAYPSRLLVYNAGTGKTTFLGIMKVTTVFLFGASCLILAPHFYTAVDGPNVQAAVVVCLIGAVPLLFQSIVTAPFVNSVYLYLPIHARQSRQLLERYVSKLPKEAELEFVTIRLVGAQKTVGTHFHQLRALDQGFSPLRPLQFANLERIPIDKPVEKSALQKLFGWVREPRNRFYVKDNDRRGMNRSTAPGIWNMIQQQIPQKS